MEEENSEAEEEELAATEEEVYGETSTAATTKIRDRS